MRLSSRGDSTTLDNWVNDGGESIDAEDQGANLGRHVRRRAFVVHAGSANLDRDDVLAGWRVGRDIPPQSDPNQLVGVLDIDLGGLQHGAVGAPDGNYALPRKD